MNFVAAPSESEHHRVNNVQGTHVAFHKSSSLFSLFFLSSLFPQRCNMYEARVRLLWFTDDG
jgi:hypothetical protein